MKNITAEMIKEAYKRLGYTFFTKHLSMNIIGIRASNGIVNKFDDLICLLYRRGNEEFLHKYQSTTDPGLYWLKNPMRADGTAIMKPGFYHEAYRIGKHKGQYSALVQVRPIPFWRDNNRDSELNYNKKVQEYAVIGANIHKAGDNSQSVDKWSAGCQVIAKASDFKTFMDLVKESSEIYGELFSYTLFDENQIPEV